MKYLKIKNNGEIDPQALHLVGASTKVGDGSKIGQFGSGNKYALCYLLRNNYEVHVFSGANKFEITTKPQTFQNQEFQRIYIEGEPTSLTTQMGKDWELWQALREIYCNAIDEGGESIETVSDFEPQVGETHFYISLSNDIQQFLKDFDQYFLRKEKVICEIPGLGRIAHKSSDVAGIYRKGIRCFNTTENSLYDYDLEDIEINEDRLVRFYWQVNKHVWHLLFACPNREVILNVLVNNSKGNYLEGYVDPVMSINAEHTTKQGSVFLEAVSDMEIAPTHLKSLLTPEEQQKTAFVPAIVFNSLRGYVESNIQDKFKVSLSHQLYRDIDPTPLQVATINKCLEFFKTVNFEIPYTIKVVQFDDSKVLGAAVKGEILLSEIGLDRGVFDVCNTIIEEFIHLKYDVKDETREFQTSSINVLLKYMQEVNAVAI